MFLWPDALPDANPFSRFLRHAVIRCTYSNRGTHREHGVVWSFKMKWMRFACCVQTISAHDFPWFPYLTFWDEHYGMGGWHFCSGHGERSSWSNWRMDGRTCSSVRDSFTKYAFFEEEEEEDDEDNFTINRNRCNEMDKLPLRLATLSQNPLIYILNIKK